MPAVDEFTTISTQALQKYMRGRIKAAAIGGGQDVPFEQAFADIAHSFLKERAPSLLEYEIGFQLLDRNEDDSKAVGVTAFKLGSQWLYAPVFFLAGRLKGNELLYLKNQDIFVPLKESWINHFLNRKPTVLGTEVTRNLTSIGVLPPNLYQLSRSPHKFASAIADESKLAAIEGMSSWAKDILPTVSHWIASNPISDEKYADLTSLPTFLKKEGAHVIKLLLRNFEDNPKLAKLAIDLHGLNLVDDAIAELKKAKEAKHTVLDSAPVHCKRTSRGVECSTQSGAAPRRMRPKPPAAGESTVTNTEPGDLLLKGANEYSHTTSAAPTLERRPLQVYTQDEVMQGGTAQHNLTTDEREKLVKDRVVIRDDRPEASIAYEMQTPTRLQNPGETGLYDVLVRENKFEKCLIIFQPYCQRRKHDFVTIVKLEDEKGSHAWLNIHPAHIWVGYQYPNKDYQTWADGLPKATELPVSDSGLHVLIANSYEGTLPFSADKEVSTTARKIYDVYFRSYAEKNRPDHLPPLRHGGEGIEYYDRSFTGAPGSRIVFTNKKGSGLRATGGDLYVPTDYRLLTLRPDNDDDAMGICGCQAHSEPAPIQPGNQFDIDLLLGTKTAAMKIYNNGTEVDINGFKTTKLGGLIYLVRDHGLREKQARLLLDRAEKDRMTRCRIKYAAGYSKDAQPYELQRTAPTAPSMPEEYVGYDPLTGGNVPTAQPSEFNLKVTDLSTSNTDRSLYHPMGPEPNYPMPPMPDRAAQNAAMQAGTTGQREVFDTSMIAGLLKAVRNDTMVERYLGDLMKGLDRLGRILFTFYWHGDKFQERYGKGEMVELEEGLRNAFESLGDIVLFLKQREIDPNPDEMREATIEI